MGKTIQDYLREKTSSQDLTTIAKAIQVSDSFLSRLRAGKIKSTKLEVAVDLALYFHEPLDKMLELIGEKEYFDKLRRLLQAAWTREPKILLVNESHAVYGKDTTALEGIKLFADPISLGPGCDISSEVFDGFAPIPKDILPIGFKSDKDRIVAFRTKGISMKPTINDGSYIWIDRLDIQPKEKEIYAFLLPTGGVTIKRLIRIQGHQLIIDGDNQETEVRNLDDPVDGLRQYPMILDFHEGDELPIRGRVIWVLNRFIEKPQKQDAH